MSWLGRYVSDGCIDPQFPVDCANELFGASRLCPGAVQFDSPPILPHITLPRESIDSL
jgi:hypothetical protein